MFTFSEMLALVQSESSFGAFVFHRRPAGLQATSDLVDGKTNPVVKVVVGLRCSTLSSVSSHERKSRFISHWLWVVSTITD